MIFPNVLLGRYYAMIAPVLHVQRRPGHYREHRESIAGTLGDSPNDRLVVVGVYREHIPYGFLVQRIVCALRGIPVEIVVHRNKSLPVYIW